MRHFQQSDRALAEDALQVSYRGFHSMHTMGQQDQFTWLLYIAVQNDTAFAEQHIQT